MVRNDGFLALPQTSIMAAMENTSIQLIQYEELKPKQMDVIIGGFYFLVDKAGGLKVEADQVTHPSSMLRFLDKSSKKCSSTT